MLLESSLEAQANVEKARREVDERSEAARQGSISIDSIGWQQGPMRLTVLATNDGSVGFDGAQVEVVVDGEVATFSITHRLVEGAATDVWSPGTQMELRLSLSGYTGSSAPQDVLIVTDRGTKAYWRA